jgi:transcription initiation factor IIF auxiliary subunit
LRGGESGANAGKAVFALFPTYNQIREELSEPAFKLEKLGWLL